MLVEWLRSMFEEFGYWITKLPCLVKHRYELVGENDFYCNRCGKVVHRYTTTWRRLTQEMKNDA